TAKFAATISQDPQKLKIIALKKRNHTIIEQIGRRERGLAIIELGKGHLGVGVDEGLLVDAANPLQMPDIERVLSAAVAGVLALEFAVRLFLQLGFFQRHYLDLGQHQTHLAKGGLLNSKGNYRILDILRYPILQHRLLAADLCQGKLTALVVELLKAIEAVPAIPHHFAGMAHTPKLLGQLEQPDLCADDLLFGSH